MFRGNGIPAPLYVSADKSPKAVRTEVQVKRPSKIMQNAVPDVDIRTHRTLGYISNRGDALVRLL
eukprot:4718527-Pyramimonas_sp.AAC.1